MGWEIRVDQTGRPQGVLTMTVTSDPTMVDTDEDGLPDGLERLSGASPNRADTDGDGLNDVDEVQRWGTSPASVDTDGDSRGPNPDASAAPNVALFDAAELTLVPDPMRPGEMTSSPRATSPLLADTDGDGRTDYDELAVATRNAVRAEVPALTVTITPGSEFGLWLETTETASTARSEEHGDSLAVGGGFSTEVWNSTSLTWGAYLTTNNYVGVVVDIGADLDNLGANAGVHVSSDYRVGSTLDLTTSFGMSAGLRTSVATAETDVESQVEARTHTVSGARIVMSADIVNTGDVPFRLRNLRVAAMYGTPGDAYLRPLGTLAESAMTASTEGFVFSRGESVTMFLETREAEPGLVAELMRNPGRIFVTPANYEILDAGDEEYAFVQSRVAERCARITLDGVASMSGRHEIAANVRRDPMGEEEGLRVSEILEMLRIPFMAEPIAADPPPLLQQYAFEIGGRRTTLHTGPPPDLGDPPYPPSVSIPARVLREGWFAVFVERNGRVRFYENMFEARVLPGDELSLLYSEDIDRDGLSAIEEDLLGTADDAADTDGDGLSDFFEHRVGWYVEVRGQVPRRVYPSPTLADADADGLDDRAERFGGARADGFGTGTDPTRADTDRDGQDDGTELGAGRDPLDFDTTTGVAPGVRCRVSPERVALEPTVTVLEANAEMDAAPFVSITVSFDDGHVETLPVVPPSPMVSWELLRSGRGRSISAMDQRGSRHDAIDPCCSGTAARCGF